MCALCGQVETVEHQLVLCANAARIWHLYQRITHQASLSLYDILTCGSNLAHEIVKSVFMRALIQIDRSSNRIDRDLLTECVFYLNIEAQVNARRAAEIAQLTARITAMR